MENANAQVQISAEMTPNPNTLKFAVNRKFLEAGGLDFPDKETAQKSIMAARLFEMKEVTGVFVGTNFITVTREPKTDWNALVPRVVESIKAVLATGEPIVQPEVAATATSAAADPIGSKIREILDREIRPAVAMDGGDITFLGYKDGIVTLHLKGSCSSCPSSIMTLKMGVENRLKASIPEVKEVVQV